MDINKKLIGKRIKHRREVSGLSQEQLAERLDLSTNHISSMECGKCLVTTKSLLALCDVLGGTPNYYLVGEIAPEADDITVLAKQLSPTEQKMLCTFCVLIWIIASEVPPALIKCKEIVQNC